MSSKKPSSRKRRANIMLGSNYKTSSFSVAAKKTSSSVATASIDVSITLAFSMRSRLRLNIIFHRLSILALRLNKLSYISILALRLNESKLFT